MPSREPLDPEQLRPLLMKIPVRSHGARQVELFGNQRDGVLKVAVTP